MITVIKKSLQKSFLPLPLVIAFMLFTASGLGYGANTYYVDAARPDDSGDGANWATAKKTIQAAVVLATNSDTVLVTNGVYDIGGAVTPGYALTNRVCITNAITVRSFNNDPTNTIIKGTNATGGGCGTDAIRCVFLDNTNAFLIGFTLTNGYTMTTADEYHNRCGGGVFIRTNAVVSNCVISGNSANYRGAGACLYYGGTLNNCTVVGNSGGTWCGGVDFLGSGDGRMNNCTVSRNNAGYGGGVIFDGDGTMNNCTVSENTAWYTGGGAWFGTSDGRMNNCTLSGNTSGLSSTYGGGGACFYRGGTLSNCTISGNTGGRGGGIYFSSSDSNYNKGRVVNCVIVSNTGNSGGGVYVEKLGGALTNCTVVGNTASTTGGGVYVSSTATGNLNNCIIWGNNGNNSNVYSTSDAFIVSYTCSGPIREGERNIGSDPQFVDTNSGNYRLMVNSPCINTGTNQSWMTNSYDLDGRTRIRYGTVDMGAYETIYNGTIYRIP